MSKTSKQIGFTTVKTILHTYDNGVQIVETRTSNEDEQTSTYFVTDGKEYLDRQNRYLFIPPPNQFLLEKAKKGNLDDIRTLEAVSVLACELIKRDIIDRKCLFDIQTFNDGFIYPWASEMPLNTPLHLLTASQQYRRKSLLKYWADMPQNGVISVNIVEEITQSDDYRDTIWNLEVCLSDELFEQLFNEVGRDIEQRLRYDKRDFLGLLQCAKDEDD
jgi:hypothetical protein